MDTMILESKLMRGFISKLMKKAIKKNVGCETDITINEINAKIVEGEASVHISIDAKMSKEELMKLLAKAGL